MSDAYLHVWDNALPEAAALEVRRRLVGEAKWGPVFHNGMEYHGIASFDGDLETNLKRAIHASLSTVIGHSFRPRLSFFRKNSEGDKPRTYIHADHTEAKYAGVLYLSEIATGGTAFWVRRNMWEYKDGNKVWLYDPECCPKCDSDTYAMNMDGRLSNDAEPLAFYKSMVVPMKFNRFVVYPANRWHSRYPFQTWGTEPANSRLIFATFFDL